MDALWRFFDKLIKFICFCNQFCTHTHTYENVQFYLLSTLFAVCGCLIKTLSSFAQLENFWHRQFLRTDEIGLQCTVALSSICVHNMNLLQPTRGHWVCFFYIPSVWRDCWCRLYVLAKTSYVCVVYNS